jgi:hypothetical protein
MAKKFIPMKWYTHDNGTFTTTFLCLAMDGEYLYPTRNINSTGFSILLCREATAIEIYEAKKLLSKKK